MTRAPAQERQDERERPHEWLDVLLAGMSLAVVVADPESRRIVHASPRAEQLLGTDVRGAVLPRDDVAAFDLDGVRIAPEDLPLARALLRGEAVRGERLRLRRPDGSTIVLGVNAASLLGPDGEAEACVGVFWDDTESHRRERIQRDFVTNAAHELQTPLAAIVSAAEVLDAGAKEEPEARDRFLSHIRRECDRLARLVYALLTLARAQASEEAPPREELMLQPLLDEVALSVTPAAGVEVRVDCAKRLVAYANRSLLEQAVAGLAANAAKYTTPGTIWLRARANGEDAVEIEVADDGVGLPPGDEERLFERFYRGEGARDASGFGLGLAIVRESVAALGGEVELRRRRPRGTSARIVLSARGRT